MPLRRLTLAISLLLAFCLCAEAVTAAQRSRGGSRGGTPSRSSGGSRPSSRPASRPASRPVSRPTPTPSRPTSRPTPSARPTTTPSRPTSRPTTTPRPTVRPTTTPDRSRSTGSTRGLDTGRSTGSTRTTRDVGPTRDLGGSSRTTTTPTPSRDLAPPTGRSDGLSGGVRDALDSARPSTTRTTVDDRGNVTTRTRTTYGRDEAAGAGRDAWVDLRPASSPAPQRVRFPRSYAEGQRERGASDARADRGAALERERLYSARLAGRDAARADVSADRGDARTRTRDTLTRDVSTRGATRNTATRDTTTRSAAADDLAERRSARRARAAQPSPDSPRLSDRRAERARQIRADRQALRASDARIDAQQRARAKENADLGLARHRERAKNDKAYSDRVRADAATARAANQLALDVGIGLGVSLGGGWVADFGIYYGSDGYDNCYDYWCPTPYGYNTCWGRWSWNLCWWWYPSYCWPGYSYYYPRSYCDWWYPYYGGYYGSTVIVQEAPVEYVYVEEAPAADAAPAAGPVGAPSDGTPSDSSRRAAARYLQLGDDAFQLGEYGRAAHYYAKAIEMAPDDGVLYLVLSDALFATGDYHYAAYALRRALELEPELARMQFDKRDLYSDPQDFDDQLAQLELYLDDHFLDEDARLVLVANYLFGGAPTRALDMLEDPFSVEVLESPAGELLRSAARVAVEQR